VRGLEAMDCRGLNVTLPHKRAVASLTADLTPLARRLGAVNTLVRRSGGGWLGTNTDVEGFLAPLRANEPQGSGGHGGWRERQALVLGCGGSARAVLAGLLELGLGRIRVAGRQARSLAPFLESCRSWAAGLETLTWRGSDLEEALSDCDLLVNTTPVGMAMGGNGSALESSPLPPRQLELLGGHTIVYDLIYTPRPTALLRGAAARGCRTIDGLEMLVQQGAASLRLWSGETQVPVAVMRQAALARLQGS
jgi:shikimate dehydrogenase